MKFDLYSYYRLSTSWQGPENCLTITNENQKPLLCPKNNSDRQLWKIIKIKENYYRIINKNYGLEKSLDILDNGIGKKVGLNDSEDKDGQFWKFLSLGNGYFKLSTLLKGEGRSLDVVNDGNNNKIKLSSTGNYSGQKWKFQKVK